MLLFKQGVYPKVNGSSGFRTMSKISGFFYGFPKGCYPKQNYLEGLEKKSLTKIIANRFFLGKMPQKWDNAGAVCNFGIGMLFL